MPLPSARPHSWRVPIAAHRALRVAPRATCSRSRSNRGESGPLRLSSSTRTATRGPPSARSARNNRSSPSAVRGATARYGPSAPGGGRSGSRSRRAIRSPLSLVEHLLDGVHHRISAGGLRGGGGLAGLAEVLRDARECRPRPVVFPPPPPRRVECHRLPLGMAVLHEPGQIGRDRLRELAHKIAIPTAEVEGAQHRLHPHPLRRL